MPELSNFVLAIIQAIPDTQNPRILEDLADALMTMPANLVAQFADRIAGWTTYRFQLLLPRLHEQHSYFPQFSRPVEPIGGDRSFPAVTL